MNAKNVFRCQSCGSSDITELEDNLVRCNHCDSVILCEEVAGFNTQRVLGLFKDIQNYEQFERLQQQKTTELKIKRWKDFKSKHKVKKWLYYAFLSLPYIFAIFFFICMTNYNFYLASNTKRDVIFVFTLVFFYSSIPLTVLLHRTKFKVNIVAQLTIPLILAGLTLPLYYGIRHSLPVSCDGQTLYELGACRYNDGLFYLQECRYEGYFDAQIYTYGKNYQLKKYYYDEDGKKVLKLPNTVSNLSVTSVIYEYQVLEDVEILILPKFADSITIKLPENSKLTEIYCYGKNETTVWGTSITFASYSNVNDIEKITIYYATDKPSASFSNRYLPETQFVKENKYY